MANALKGLVKDTAVYGLSSILGRFLNWALTPLYTRVLVSTGEFGVQTNLYAWTALLMAILTYGMETGFFRFIRSPILSRSTLQPLSRWGLPLRSLPSCPSSF